MLRIKMTAARMKKLVRVGIRDGVSRLKKDISIYYLIV